MKTSLIILYVLAATISVAQTKLISHKSHSGSNAEFKKTIIGKLFTIEQSNFGQAPQRFVRNSKLDTIKLLSPQVAVMVTSESCHYEDYNGRPESDPSLWSAGTDTVYDHPLFNKKNTVEEIKRGLKNDYYFTNNVNNVVFIGFDGKYATVNTPKVKEEEPEDDNEKYAFRKNGTRRSYFMIIIISLLSTVFTNPF